MPDLVGITLGSYTITALIGEGGMADVYQAHQATLNREVAIKVMRGHMLSSTESIRRFKREAQTIASLNQPHIVKVYEYGEYEGLPYLVMELLNGGSLAEIIGREGYLSLEKTSAVLDQIAGALDYAHRRGIVHRDLKPQNILFSDSGDAVLTDFGIVKLLYDTSALTGADTLIGTPRYMAPEQWKDEPIDKRTDLYALGIIVYEMLTGAAPFTGSTPASVMYKHLNETPQPLSVRRGELPVQLQAVINKAVAKQPDDRYQSASELASTFRQSVTENVGNSNTTVVSSLRQTANLDPIPPTQIELLDTVKVDSAAMPKPRARGRTSLWVVSIVLLLLVITGVILAALSQQHPTQVASEVSATSTSAISATPIIASTPVQSGLEELIAYKTEVASTYVALASTNAAQSTTIANLQSTSQAATETSMFTMTAVQATAFLTVSPIPTTRIQAQTPTLDLTATRQAQDRLATSTAAAATIAIVQAPSATAQTIQSVISQLKNSPNARVMTSGKSGVLTHGATNGRYESYNAGFDARNFILRVTFTNPYDGSDPNSDIWDYGIIFRQTGTNREYRLVLLSDLGWFLLLYDGSADNFQQMDTSVIPDGALRLEDGDTNTLEVVVENQLGYFFLNGYFIDTFFVADKMDSGQLLITIGNFVGYEQRGKQTKYSDLEIIILP